MWSFQKRKWIPFACALAWPFRNLGLLKWVHFVLNEKELWIAKRLARKDKIFVDVGSCKGVYTLTCGHYFRFVHCFEPTPLNIEYLNEVVIHESTKIHTCALGAVLTTAALYWPMENNRRTRLGWSTLSQNIYSRWEASQNLDVQVSLLMTLIFQK